MIVRIAANETSWTASPAAGGVPPLQPGDNLGREEFLRLWQQHPEIKRAELLAGVVYMPSPLSVQHGNADNRVGTLFGYYALQTPGTEAGNNATTMLLEDVPQPDVHLRILPECGGATELSGPYLAGPPELIAEICLSSAAYDLHQKKDLYEKAGVREYLAVLLFERTLHWHVLRDGKFDLLPPDGDGIHRSRVFPGLWLDGAALFARDDRRLLDVLHQGLASAEHQAFVQELARRKA